MKAEFHSRGYPVILICIFLALVFAVVFIGYRYYLNQKERTIAEKYQELAAIADLKVDQIVKWRAERLDDDLLFLGNPAFAQSVDRFLSNPHSSAKRREVIRWLSPINRNRCYHSVIITDTRVRERLTLGAEKVPVGSLTRTLAIRAMRSGRMIISDLHHGDYAKLIHLDALIPLYVSHGGTPRLVGAALVRVNPSHELYPLVQSWPTPSRTAESLLARREGKDLVFLNELRHRKGTALSLRVPLTKSELPAVRAVQGYKGYLHGTDYRGVPVLAVARRIPGSPWSLVAKIDAEEVVAPARYQAWVTGAFSVLLVLFAGMGVGLIWRHTTARFYKRLYEEERAQHVLAQHIERLNSMYLTLSRVNKAIVRCREKQELFEEICRIIVEHGGLRMAWIGLTDRDSRLLRPWACSGHVEGYLEKISVSTDTVPAGRGPAGTAVREGRYVACQDIATDRSMEPWRKEALGRGYRSVACFPLFRASESVGALCTYAAESTFFDGEIVALLDELAADISFALSSMEHAEALLSSEKKYRLLFDNMINGFAMHELIHDETGKPADYRILDVNLAFVEITGISRERAVGGSGSQVYGTGTPPYLDIYADVAQNGSTAVFDTYFPPLNQYFSISVFSPAKGQFATVFTDITDKTKAEAQIRVNEARLQSLYNISQYRAANVQDLLDFSLAEALRLTSSTLGHICFYDEEKREFSLNSWSNDVLKECAVAEPQTRYELEKTGIWGEAVRQRRPILVNDFQGCNPLKKGYPKGHVELLSCLTIPVFSGEKIVAVVGVANKEGAYDETDVRQLTLLSDSVWKYVERKNSEEELIRLNVELETRVLERTADLESFSYTVSHDLRAPLRAISGFSGMLLDGYAGSLDAGGRRLLDVIIDNTRRMGQLIDDLLAFSRVGRADPGCSRIDMTCLAASVRDELLSGEAGALLDCRISPLPEAVGDSAMIRQVWVNLLSNAVKFTLPKGSGVVEVSGSSTADERIYSVKDTGVGFDMEYAEKLFCIFQRLHSSADFEGTGVGLAIVQRIISRHGGRVWAEGRPGDGATFRFSLPVNRHALQVFNSV
jgi:signal transduction histidine kinase/PAS domain-containing protein